MKTVSEQKLCPTRGFGSRLKNALTGGGTRCKKAAKFATKGIRTNNSMPQLPGQSHRRKFYQPNGGCTYNVG